MLQEGGPTVITENKVIEFKREYTDDIKKTVVAFANTDGGKLYIGIDDDGTIRGLLNPDEVMQSVTNSIRDTISPDVTLFVDTTIEELENKQVLVVTVQRGIARPYYLKGKGIRPEGVLVRQGASTVPATTTMILNMIKEASGDSYENARSLNQQLTFHETSKHFKKEDVSFGDSQKKTLHLIGEDGMYTNLAFLLSDQCTHSIKLAVFEGNQKAVFKERREFSGSLLRQIEEAYAFIDRFNRTRAEFKGLSRMDVRDYPTEAIRESLLNAIVHRDYAYSGSTLISIFDNRLEIVTLGGLTKGISIEDILLGVSMLRNQQLANIFYRLVLIEAYGTGIPRIMESYDGYPNKPKIQVTDNAFKIILPNRNSFFVAENREYYSVINDREALVLSLFDNQEVIVRKDVEQITGMSQAISISLLRDMVEKGLIVKMGAGKLTKYKKK
jgi:ATP-dependent DNA helicase RecG